MERSPRAQNLGADASLRAGFRRDAVHHLHQYGVRSGSPKRLRHRPDHGVPPLAASRGALRSCDGHGGAARCFPHDGGRRQKRGGCPHRQGVAAGGILCGTRFSHPLHPGNGIRLLCIPVGPLQPGGRALHGGSAGSLFPGPAGLCRDQGGAARLPSS